MRLYSRREGGRDRGRRGDERGREGKTFLYSWIVLTVGDTTSPLVCYFLVWLCKYCMYTYIHLAGVDDVVCSMASIGAIHKTENCLENVDDQLFSLERCKFYGLCSYWLCSTLIVPQRVCVTHIDWFWIIGCVLQLILNGLLQMMSLATSPFRQTWYRSKEDDVLGVSFLTWMFSYAARWKHLAGLLSLDITIIFKKRSCYETFLLGTDTSLSFSISSDHAYTLHGLLQMVSYDAVGARQ